MELSFLKVFNNMIKEQIETQKQIWDWKTVSDEALHRNQNKMKRVKKLQINVGE